MNSKKTNQNTLSIEEMFKKATNNNKKSSTSLSSIKFNQEELDILSRKGPKIINKIKENKIYLLFCKDMPKEYIEIFTNKIINIKNLGLFFEILPKENGQKNGNDIKIEVKTEEKKEEIPEIEIEQKQKNENK